MEIEFNSAHDNYSSIILKKKPTFFQVSSSFLSQIYPYRYKLLSFFKSCIICKCPMLVLSTSYDHTSLTMFFTIQRTSITPVSSKEGKQLNPRCGKLSLITFLSRKAADLNPQDPQYSISIL